MKAFVTSIVLILFAQASFAFSTWFFEELGQKELPDDAKVTIDANYNVIACQVLGRIKDDPKQLVSVYGVVVDPDGAVKGEPRLVLSSGFEYFNQQALDAIAKYDFSNETGSDRPLLVDVVFKYSDEKCPPVPSVPAEDSPAG